MGLAYIYPLPIQGNKQQYNELQYKGNNSRRNNLNHYSGEPMNI